MDSHFIPNQETEVAFNCGVYERIRGNAFHQTEMKKWNSATNQFFNWAISFNDALSDWINKGNNAEQTNGAPIGDRIGLNCSASGGEWQSFETVGNNFCD